MDKLLQGFSWDALLPDGGIDPGFTVDLSRYEDIARIVLPIAAALAAGLAVLMLIARWNIFVKAGADGWKALIPICHLHTQLKFTWRPRLLCWYYLLPLIIAGTLWVWFWPEIGPWLWGTNLALLVSVVALVYLQIKLRYKLARSFGRGGGFTLGLLFLPLIFLPVLAFGRARYLGKPL